jgi:hypothetical protein
MSIVTIQGNAGGTGTLTIAAPNTNSNYTINLPTVTGGSFIASDSSGNVGIGTDAPAEGYKLTVADKAYISSDTDVTPDANWSGQLTINGDGYRGGLSLNADGIWLGNNSAARAVIFATNETERARIDSSGTFLVGKTDGSTTTVGSEMLPDGRVIAVVGTGESNAVYANRQNDDGVLVSLRQANTQEGNISVSGSTVSYNGGHLSRWAQTTTAKDESLVKGTVLSNLDEMNVYTDADGNPVENEQLNKVKVSDVEGDVNVAGVFVNWDYDEDHNVDEINMAMTGDMIIRIAAGTTVQRGDLLMSAGNGTAKPQGDDIVRSKTVAKVTSTHVTCTYEDGSFCVPCVLMAC